MISQSIGETKAESVDIKEYIAILLKRKWLILVCFLLSMAATTAFLFTRQPIYRANAKLLVTAAGGALPLSDVSREEGNFYTTQVDIMLSQTMLRRVQQRMRKTAEEIRENLANLTVAPVRGSAIMVITVDSPSEEFAKDFANALIEEYLRFRDEQRAQSSESALLMLTREVNRLGQELKAANERMLAFSKEHNLPDVAGQSYMWWKRYALNAGKLAGAIGQLAETKARKELLESSADTATVLALLASQALAEPRAEGGVAGVAKSSSRLIERGDVVNIGVIENPSLNSRQTVSPEGQITYPPLGAIQVAGLTVEQVEQTIAEKLRDAGLVKARGYVDQWNKFEAADVQKEAGGILPTVKVIAQSAGTGEAVDPFMGDAAAQSRGDDPLTGNQVAWGTLSEIQAQRLFELERRKTSLASRIATMQTLYKAQHPAMVALQNELAQVTDALDAEIQFLRKKAEADYIVAHKRYQEILATSKEMDAAAFMENRRAMEFNTLKDEADRIRALYNTLLGQVMKIDVSQGFNARTVSVLEPAILEAGPVYPKKLKGLLVAAFFGLGLGLALAFFIEYIDDSIKLAEEVERDLQLPFLGMIPAAQWNPDDLTAHRLDQLKQQGGVAESYRVVRSAIIFSTPRDKLRSILVTSAVPREGKTTTCINLAIGFSQIENRVLVLDGDLRRGEIHKFFGLEKEKGLADLLLGEATIDEVLKHSDVPKLDVITCGAYPANPAELLLGWRLKELLEWAHKHYDRVIVDCPPVMGIADSVILGSAVDGVLFVIWAGRTSRRYVRVAKMTAVSRGAKLFGFVLNNLEPGRVGYYHYYPYYYSYYSRGYYYAHKEDEGKGGDIKGIKVPTQEQGKGEIDDVY